jgi:hypothetical protein
MPQGNDVSADLAERLRFESLVIDLAAGLVKFEPERVDQAIEDCLRHIVEALHLDRTTLFQRSAEDLVVAHSWAVPWAFGQVVARVGRDAAPRFHPSGR